MSSPTDPRFARRAVWSCLAAILFVIGQARAINPVITKLHGRAPISHAGDRFGHAVAVNETWIVVGAPFDDERAPDAGAVFVFSASTGQFVRKLRAPDATLNDQFGSSVALCANQVLIGAPFKNAEQGKAYLFNLSTGALVSHLSYPLSVPGDRFGHSVALNSAFAAVGAPLEAGLDGAVHLFGFVPSPAPSRIPAPTAGLAGQFGDSIVLVDNLIVVGEPSNDTEITGAGAAYVLNLNTGSLIHSIPSTSGASGGTGTTLAADAGRVVVGARRSPSAGTVFDLATGAELQELGIDSITPSTTPGYPAALRGDLALIGGQRDDTIAVNAGAAFLFDARTGVQLHQILAPDGQLDDAFGSSVALSGNLAVIGAPFDDDLGENAGAIYLVRPLYGPLPLATVAKVGDFAPGAPETRFRTFGTAHVDSGGSVMFNAGLAGAGSNGSTDTGVWSTIDNPLSLDLSRKSREDLSDRGTFEGQSYVGVRTGALQSPVLRGNIGLFQSTLAGTGVTLLNNRALFRDDGASPVVPVFRTDRAIGQGLSGGEHWNGARVKSILWVAMSGDEEIVVPCSFRTGIAGTTATNDTGILVLNLGGSVVSTSFREGFESPTGDLFGQFAGRASADPSLWFAYRAFVLPAGQTPKQAIFYGAYTGGGDMMGIQGDAPGPAGGAKYASFTGESLVGAVTYWMATLTGTGVTSLNNQSLWSESRGLILRTSDQIQPALFVSRIEKYWAFGSNRAIIQVLLRGNGVTTANNRALYLWSNNGSANGYQRLLRAGDIIEGCAPAKIGALQQVAVDSTSGRYAILASLIGAPAATNQALFTGGAGFGDDFVAKRVLRQPFMVMRKGRPYQSATGQNSTLLSMSLSNTTDADGAGNKGTGQVINAGGQIVINILLNNLAREIMVGVP
jgi:hypothetical protein